MVTLRGADLVKAKIAPASKPLGQLTLQVFRDQFPQGDDDFKLVVEEIQSLVDGPGEFRRSVNVVLLVQ